MSHAQHPVGHDPVDHGREGGTDAGAGRMRVPRWLRILIPALLIIAWLAAAGVGGPYFGRVSEVSTNDQTSYLPSSSEATEVQNLLPKFSGSDAIPAVVVFVSDTKLSRSDRTALGDELDRVANLDGVDGAISPLIPSKDGKAAQAFVPLVDGNTMSDTVAAVRASLADHVPDGVQAYVTGPAGFVADLIEGFTGIDGLLLLVAMLAVFIILVLVYRSLLLPVAVLATSMVALTAALLSVWWLAKAGVLLLSGQTQGILFILVIGATTDYALLYTARYREQLRVQQDRWRAIWAALRGTVEPIVASGCTVIAGLLCLLFSDLKSNSTLGPIAAIGIVFAMLAALTLLPAVLYFFGRTAYWPRRPKYEPDAVVAEQGVREGGLWAWLVARIRRRPRSIWIVTALVLLIGATGVTQLQAAGVPQSDLVLGSSQARDGQQVLGEHFAGGSGSPAYVVVARERMQKTADTLLDTPGVTAVSVASSDSPSGSAQVTSKGITAQGAPGTSAPAPTEVDGRVMLEATLAHAADSDSAEKVVRRIRSQLGDAALVGGVTATAIDTNDAAIHDRNTIIPIVLIVIMLILMLLLRSILAPVLLILTTLLSFLTALGVSALVFNHVLDFPGADASVPLYGFVFLVALGIDYNIFLMTRVREESLAHGTRSGVLRGLAITGGVITSAGLVLAATFAALSVIPILFLVQIAFIVAFGVLLDTFLVRSLLVPALLYDIGARSWWPSKLARVTSR